MLVNFFWRADEMLNPVTQRCTKEAQSFTELCGSLCLLSGFCDLDFFFVMIDEDMNNAQGVYLFFSVSSSPS